MADWTPITPEGDIPTPRQSHTAVLTENEEMIIYGGIKDFSESGYIQNIEVYDISK